ncbi:hypothetical protein DYH09_11515 [bacterium CPR1]|nr:hypothetical protein [bacterium CPR1]
MASVGRFREQMLTCLTVGAELEHALCCQYLFAAFSLKKSVQEDLSWADLETVREWTAALLLVARQEMEHLGYVCNLMTALGGTPHLERASFPYAQGYWPTHLRFELKPFSVESLTRFVEYERPQGVRDEFSRPVERFPHPPSASQRFTEMPMEFEAVGDIYAHIQRRLESCPYDDEALFVGPRRAQIDNELLGNDRRGYAGVNVNPVVDRTSALAAVGQIIEEGEGSTTVCPTGHYQIFLDILRDLVSRPAGFSPARPVADNPCVRPAALAGGAQVISDPFTSRVADLFDGCYELMLGMLYRFSIQSEESPEEMAFLQRMTFFPMMTQIIRPLGELLTELPMGPDHPGLNAGPTFERPRMALVSSHRLGAWTMIRERFQDLSHSCQKLADRRSDLERLQLLAQVLKRLSMLCQGVRAC